MLNLKPVATLMVTNVKELSVSSFDSDVIDLTLYIKLIGSLMSIHGRTETETLGGNKTHLEISQRDHYLWSEIYI